MIIKNWPIPNVTQVCGLALASALWSLRNNSNNNNSGNVYGRAPSNRLICWSNQGSGAGDSKNRPRPAANPYGSSALDSNPFVLGSGSSKQHQPMALNGGAIHLQTNSIGGGGGGSNSMERPNVGCLSGDETMIEKWRGSFDGTTTTTAANAMQKLARQPPGPDSSGGPRIRLAK